MPSNKNVGVMDGMLQKAAVIGAGEIGVAMAAVFLDAGVEVEIVEPSDTVRKCIPDRLGEFQREMVDAGLASPKSDGQFSIHAAITLLPDVTEIVFEAGPEDVATKRQIFASLRERLGPDTPIATTSSAITVSRMVKAPEDRRASLVAHPANPPSLIRAIECVPSPETDPAVTERVMAFLESVGFAPIRIRREVEGFAMNRLQSALLREAYRLVDAGIVDVEGADRLVSEALGPRWALSGPFETADLNTPGGLRAHAERLGAAYGRIGTQNGEKGLPWPEALVDKVVRQRRAVIPEERLADRVAWRRRALLQILHARREADGQWAKEGDISDE